MRTYNEKEVMQIVSLACGTQKAEDYQMVLSIIADDTITQEQADDKIGNFLYNDTFVSVSIEEINEYLNDK